MRKFFLMVMTVGAMAPAGAYAQKVYKSANNEVILDLTVNAGMPAGAITSAAKYASFTPSASAEGANNTENGSINEKVFQKLEVAKHDLSGSGTTASGGGTFTWVNAFNFCKAIGTGWRLPTERELQLMFIFRPALKDLFGAETFSSARYWSSTESSSTWSWLVDFTNGFRGNGPKTTSYRARCVREVTN